MITIARRVLFLELSRSEFLMLSVTALHNAEMLLCLVPGDDDFSFHKFCHR